MVSIIRKTGKSNNEYIGIEDKKAEGLMYWQALINRPK
jgi:low affinity Fe/Cu permease